MSGYGDWSAEFLDAVGVDEPALVMGHSFGGGVAVMLAHDHPQQVRALVLINSVGGSAWSHHGSTFRSMAERPLWDWGIHLPGDILPIRQARRVLPVIINEAFPNIWRDPGRSGGRPVWPAAPTSRPSWTTSGSASCPSWSSGVGVTRSSLATASRPCAGRWAPRP